MSNDINWSKVSALLDIIHKAATAGPQYISLVTEADAELQSEINYAKAAAAVWVKAKLDAEQKAAAIEAERQATLAAEQESKLKPHVEPIPAMGGPMGVPEPEPTPTKEPA